MKREIRQRVEMMELSNAAFDAGRETEALRLAVDLRVLLHTSTYSHALLAQTQPSELRTLQYVDLASPSPLAQLLPANPALYALAGDAATGRLTYQPRLVGSPLPPGLAGRTTPFDQWWTTEIERLGAIRWSRQKFVCTVANQEGGAHVDPMYDDAYEAMKRPQWEMVMVTPPAPPRTAEGNPVWSSIRAISDEVVATIRGAWSRF